MPKKRSKRRISEQEEPYRRSAACNACPRRTYKRSTQLSGAIYPWDAATTVIIATVPKEYSIRGAIDAFNNKQCQNRVIEEEDSYWEPSGAIYPLNSYIRGQNS